MASLKDNFYYLQLLMAIYVFTEAGEVVPEDLLEHTIDVGKQIPISDTELAVLESIESEDEDIILH